MSGVVLIQRLSYKSVIIGKSVIATASGGKDLSLSRVNQTVLSFREKFRNEKQLRPYRKPTQVDR